MDSLHVGGAIVSVWFCVVELGFEDVIVRLRLGRVYGKNSEESGVEVWRLYLEPKYDTADTPPRLITPGPNPLLLSNIVYSIP